MPFPCPGHQNEPHRVIPTFGSLLPCHLSRSQVALFPEAPDTFIKALRNPNREPNSKNPRTICRQARQHHNPVCSPPNGSVKGVPFKEGGSS